VLSCGGIKSDDIAVGRTPADAVVEVEAPPAVEAAAAAAAAPVVVVMVSGSGTIGAIG